MNMDMNTNMKMKRKRNKKKKRPGGVVFMGFERSKSETTPHRQSMQKGWKRWVHGDWDFLRLPAFVVCAPAHPLFSSLLFVLMKSWLKRGKKKLRGGQDLHFAAPTFEFDQPPGYPDRPVFL